MNDLRNAWRHATDNGRICGLQLMGWSVGGAGLLLTAIAVFLALEPAP